MFALLLLLYRHAFASFLTCVSFLIVACLYLHYLAPKPETRFAAERARYVAGLEGRPYGAQFSESVDGRRLTYWCFRISGVDNATGIIFDPDDRLTIENDLDRLAFQKVTHGVIYGIRRLDKNWYFVSHS